MMPKRSFTKDYKLEVIQLARTSGKSKAQLERELGLTPGQIGNWEKALEQGGQQAFPGTSRQTETEAELRPLRRENEILRQERDILRSHGCLRQTSGTPRPAVTFAFIKDHEREFKVKIMCRVLDASYGGYYAWLRRQKQPPGQRGTANRQLSEQIQTVFRRSRGTYGSPRIHAELRATGWTCSRNLIRRLERQAPLPRHGNRTIKLNHPSLHVFKPSQ
jgi:transposase-like protein